jgi:hypothetical protein
LRELSKEEFHHLYSSPNNYYGYQSGRMRLAVFVACPAELGTNACRILVSQPEEVIWET